jgi:hypothetical protein
MLMNFTDWLWNIQDRKNNTKKRIQLPGRRFMKSAYEGVRLLQCQRHEDKKELCTVHGLIMYENVCGDYDK